ncbi:MAG: tetratricopeptide repeat protein [Saprospiraceae bacterium]|nr:tetratricopeptide repeat protein [Saprospiraceae bacterium]
MGQKAKKNKPNQAEPVKIQTQNESIPGLRYLYILLAFTFLIFSPSLKCDFVNWDDDRNVYENILVKEFDVVGIFTQNVIGNYNPLSILSFALEHKFFGMDPKVMHFNNVLLHLLCVFFSFLIFSKLGLQMRFALLATAFFALHPLRVESVTWLTERKDVLYGLFFSSAIWLYLKNLEEYKSTRAILIFILFVLGLFAKIQMVSLPLTMLAIDYWKNRPIQMKLVFEKWHFFLGALAFGILGIIFLKDQGSLETNEAVHTGFSRLFIGSFSLLIYLIKCLIPFRMSPLYPYPESLSLWHYISMPIVLSLLAYIWYAFKKEKKAVVFGFSFFFVNIVFLLQILGAGQGYLADRFTYIAYMGLFFLFAYLAQTWSEKKPEYITAILSACITYLMVFSFLAYKQTKIWKDSGTLWTHVLQYYKNTPLPYNNRANFYRDQKKFDLALQDYSNAIKYKAGHATYNSRAKLFFQRNEDEKALLDYDKAISLNPIAEYYVNRGAAKAKLGRTEEAFADINKGLSVDPNWKTGYLNRSILYNQRGQYDLAAADIDRYLKYDASNADLWYEGARCYRAINQFEKALEYYSKAIRLKPNVGLFYLERGRTYQILGKTQLADQDLNKAQQMGESIR